ncbi:MerR family transcriptional regulator [Streptomyces sp. NPDC007088]|uniref:MerR family transcriptional regulator n=1 Tax=Streptomyces sp. NPDC007088 TaxID=3364773 RepID=UPI0036A84A19
MLTIGDFARHGRVSVRMLRHYDALGLLRPARTDPVSGYRYYRAAQLSRLNRIVALKDLGFSLQQVGRVLCEEVDAAELRGMLRLRRAQLAEEVAAGRAGLARIEARLRSIESEGRMPVEDIVVTSLPAVRVAELSGTVSDFSPEEVGPVLRPLFDRLCALLAEAGVRPSGPGLAYYTPAGGDGEAVTAHAAFPVPATASADGGWTLVDLPAVERAATLVHRGSMDEVLVSEQLLGRWLDVEGAEALGYARELYLDCPEDPAGWITELQQPLQAPRPSGRNTTEG